MRAASHYPTFLFLLMVTFFGAENLYAQVEFIENKGQWDPRVKFMSNAGDGSFFLTQKGYTISQYSPDDIENIKDQRHGMATLGEKNQKIKNNKIRAHSLFR